MARRLKMFGCAAIAACAISTQLSCSRPGPEENPEEVARWSMSFRWSGEGDVDLDSTWAQVIRAAIESNTIAEFLALEYGYPGWLDMSGAVELNAYTPHPRAEGVGTAYFHLIRQITPSGSTAAVVCKDMTQASRKAGDRYPLPNPAERRETLEAIRVYASGSVPQFSIDHTKPVKPPIELPIPGPPGRTQRPSKNVFVQFVEVFYPYGLDHNREPCLRWAESRWGSTEPPAPTRTENEPPKIEPFYPGWPT